MAKVLKSSYTLKVVPGDEYEYEMEAFFYNYKTKELEQISSSPQTMPRDLKVPFGFVENVEEVDSKIMKLVNKGGKTILLEFDKLSPLLDDQDSTMKKTLIDLKPSGCSSIVETLKKLILAFHSGENLIIIPQSLMNEETSCSGKNKLRKVITVPKEIIDETSNVQTLSVSIARSKSSYSDSNSLSLLNSDQQTESCPPEGKKRKVSDLKDVSDSEDVESFGDEVDDNNVDGEDSDIMGQIQSIIKNAEYVAVKFKNIEIPSLVKIDSLRVGQLKESVKRAPDKTQCIVGLIRTVDENGVQEGRYQCWVNAELYMAMMEIEMESEDHALGHILAVVHIVTDGGGVESSVVGSFLLNNSEEFAAKLHHKLNYQDLLRFACVTLTTENSERTRSFLKTTLRSFAKGNKNVSFFIKFASLPAAYLNKFEIFCRLFEEGSLHGMRLSFRKRMGVDKESKKKESMKIEVPLKFLKSHLDVSHAFREKLLATLLQKKITLTQYKVELIKAADLKNLKSEVEKMSGNKFEETKLSHPELLSDQVLQEFAGAKSFPAGPNIQYLKLAKHMNVLLSPDKNGEGINQTSAKVTYQANESLHLSSILNYVKQQDIVVVIKGSDKSFNDKIEFAMKQHVLGNTAVGVFIDPDMDNVKNGLDYLEEGKSDIKIEAVFVKKDKEELVEGFRKKFFPVFVMGHERLFKDKDISTFFQHQLKDALSLLLQQIVEIKSRVLIAFTDEIGAHDFDPSNVLARKEALVCYMSSKEMLTKIKTKVDRKLT